MGEVGSVEGDVVLYGWLFLRVSELVLLVIHGDIVQLDPHPQQHLLSFSQDVLQQLWLSSLGLVVLGQNQCHQHGQHCKTCRQHLEMI